MKEEQKALKVMAVPCEVYSRVVGYFRPVSSWNDGKRLEFDERKTVKLPVPPRCGCGS